MPTPAVRRAAREDVEAIAHWIARDRTAAALRFLDAAEATFAQIARTPRIGRAVRFESPHLQGLRVRGIPGFESFLVFWRVPDRRRGRVEVVRVIHGARHLPAVLEEE